MDQENLATVAHAFFLMALAVDLSICFDRRVKRLQYATELPAATILSCTNYLKDEVAWIYHRRVVDRVCDIARQGSCYSVKLRIP